MERTGPVYGPMEGLWLWQWTFGKNLIIKCLHHLN